MKHKLSFCVSFLLIPILTGVAQENLWQQCSDSFKFDKGLRVNSKGYLFSSRWEEGMFRSTDNGDTWTSINKGLTSKHIQTFTIDVHDNIYAITLETTTDASVFYSSNNGNTWKRTKQGLGKNQVSAVEVDANGNIFAATSRGIYRSRNNGDSWTQIFSKLYVETIAIDPATLFIYAGINGEAGGGLYLSTDNGDNWIEIDENLPEPIDVGLIRINARGHIFARVFGSLFRSTNNGNTWTRIKVSEERGAIIDCSVNARGYIFVLHSHEGVMCSTDNGETWTQINAGLGLEAQRMTKLAISSSGQIFAGTYDRPLFRSTVLDWPLTIRRLKWGNFISHPAISFLESAPRLDDVDAKMIALSLLRTAFDAKKFSEEPAFSEYFKEYNKATDEFQRNKLVNEIKGKFQKRQEELARTEYFLITVPGKLGEYSFNAKGFPFYMSYINNNVRIENPDTVVLPRYIYMTEEKAEQFVKSNPNRSLELTLVIKPTEGHDFFSVFGYTAVLTARAVYSVVRDKSTGEVISIFPSVVTYKETPTEVSPSIKQASGGNDELRKELSRLQTDYDKKVAEYERKKDLMNDRAKAAAEKEIEDLKKRIDELKKQVK